MVQYARFVFTLVSDDFFSHPILLWSQFDLRFVTFRIRARHSTVQTRIIGQIPIYLFIFCSFHGNSMAWVGISIFRKIEWAISFLVYMTAELVIQIMKHFTLCSHKPIPFPLFFFVSEDSIIFEYIFRDTFASFATQYVLVQWCDIK